MLDALQFEYQRQFLLNGHGLYQTHFLKSKFLSASVVWGVWRAIFYDLGTLRSSSCLHYILMTNLTRSDKIIRREESPKLKHVVRTCKGTAAPRGKVAIGVVAGSTALCMYSRAVY